MKENVDISGALSLSPQEKREKFFAIRREFGQVILFLAMLTAGFFYFIQDYRSQNFSIQTGAENIEMYQGKPHFQSGGFMFAGAECQSDEMAHSGDYSLKLDPERPYGFQMDLEGLWGNEEVVLQLWRYSPNDEGKGASVVAEVRGIAYHMQQQSIQTTEDGWELMEIRFALDCRAENKSLRVYCWNPTQTAVYFDDLNIQIKRVGIF